MTVAPPMGAPPSCASTLPFSRISGSSETTSSGVPGGAGATSRMGLWPHSGPKGTYPSASTAASWCGPAREGTSWNRPSGPERTEVAPSGAKKVTSAPAMPWPSAPERTRPVNGGSAARTSRGAGAASAALLSVDRSARGPGADDPVARGAAALGGASATGPSRRSQTRSAAASRPSRATLQNQVR